ncbi:MAG: CHAD domain-containing protein [Bryobacteraceae bacterium]
MAGKTRRKAKKIRWNVSETAYENALAELPRLADAFFEQGRAVVAPPDGMAPSVHQLHAFRLEAKRFRYTLELFQPCYGPEFETFLQSLRAIQQALGEMNDSATTARLIGEGNFKGLRGRQTFLAFLGLRMNEKAAEFRQLWSERFDARGEQRRWHEYLSGKASKEAAR